MTKKEGWVDKQIRKHPWRYRWYRVEFWFEECWCRILDYVLDRPIWVLPKDDTPPYKIRARSKNQV